MIMALALTFLTYYFCFPLMKYTNLDDFYVGISIYENFNKQFDIIIFFIYLIFFALFMAFVPNFKKIKLPEFKIKPVSEVFINSFLNISALISICIFIQTFFPVDVFSKHFPIVIFAVFILGIIFKNIRINRFVLQIAMSLGYFILYPPALIRAEEYPILLCLICAFIGITIFSAKRKKGALCVLAFVPLVIFLVGSPYSYFLTEIDDHHVGESFNILWQHHTFGAKYYKDIMLVHGFIDVVPSWIGVHIFSKVSVLCANMGGTLFSNLILGAVYLLMSYLFSYNYGYLFSLLAFRGNSILPCLYFETFLLMIKEKCLKHPFIWLIAYSVIAYALASYWTTFGTAWAVAMLPIALYLFYGLLKQKKYLEIIAILFVNVLILFIFREFFLDFLKMGMPYMHANLFGFGNNFPLKWPELVLYKAVQYVLYPLFIVVFLKELASAEKNKERLLLLYFMLIFPILIINYSFGRIDSRAMLRSVYITYNYLFFLIPYYLFLKKASSETLKNFFGIVLVILIAIKIGGAHRWSIQEPIQPSDSNKIRIENLKSVTNKYGEYLDLTNRGMNYFYLNKKMPMPYSSFYNIITTQQAQEAVKRTPQIVLISSESILHDGVYPSLRVNPIYRKLLLSGKYKFVAEKGNAFLIDENKPANYSQADLYNMDKILAKDDLEKLPEAWAMSFDSLLPRIEEVKLDYTISDGIISLKKPIRGRDVDLIYFEGDAYQMSINGSKSVLKFTSDRQKNLVPFDNFPSWLLNNDIHTITINGSNIHAVKFYKKYSTR